MPLAKVMAAGSAEAEFEPQAVEPLLWPPASLHAHPPAWVLAGWLSVFPSSSFSLSLGLMILASWNCLLFCLVPAVCLSLFANVLEPGVHPPTSWDPDLSVNLNSWVCLGKSTRLSRVSVYASLSPWGCPPPTPPLLHLLPPPTCPRPSHVPPCSPCCSWSPASSSELESGARAVPPGSSHPAPCTVPPGSSCRPTHPPSPSPSSAAPCRCHPLWAQAHEDRPQPRCTGLGPGAGWGTMGGSGAPDGWLRGKRGLGVHESESEGGGVRGRRAVLSGQREKGARDLEGGGGSD